MVLKRQLGARTLCSYIWETETCSTTQDPIWVTQTPGTMAPSAEPEGRGEAPGGPFHLPALPACPALSMPPPDTFYALPGSGLCFGLTSPASYFLEHSPLWESPGCTLWLWL